MTNVVGALDQDISSQEKVDIDFGGAVELGLVLKEDSLDTTWEVDLSGMSLPVARAACRYVARRALNEVKSRNQIVNELVFITGCKSPYQELLNKRKQKSNDDISESSSFEATGRIRDYIQGSLRNDFHPPLLTSVPERDVGTVVVRKESMQQWINSQS